MEFKTDSMDYRGMIIQHFEGYNIVHLWLNLIDNYERFEMFLKVLETLTSKDQVIMHLNCNGGDFNLASQLRNKLANRQYLLRIYIEGVAIGIGTIFFNVSDDIVVHPNILVRFNLDGFKALSKDDKFIVDFAYSVWRHILTNDEINSVLKGGELIFNSEEFANKIAKYNHIMRLLEGDIRYLKKV